MKADVKSSGNAAPRARAHNNSEPGTTSQHGDESGTLPRFIPSECFEDSAIDLMEKKLCQLNALLQSCYGGGQQNFDELAPAFRNQLVWLASDLASQIQELVTPVRDEAFERGQKTVAQQAVATGVSA